MPVVGGGGVVRRWPDPARVPEGRSEVRVASSWCWRSGRDIDKLYRFARSRMPTCSIIFLLHARSNSQHVQALLFSRSWPKNV